MDKFSKQIATRHENLQLEYVAGRGAIRLAESTGRIDALADITSGLKPKLDLTSISKTAIGTNARFSSNLASIPFHAPGTNFCFWQDSVFDLGIPASESTIAAENLSGTLNPDEFNIKSAIAVPSHPFSNGDATDWEGLIALGVGVGRLQSAVYPAINVNPNGEFTEVGGVLLGGFDINVGGATVERPFPVPSLSLGKTKITVSADWKIGFGLPWNFSPSLLLPWGGSGGKYVGVTASLVMSLIDPGNLDNSAVVEKIILFRWAASKDGMTSDDLGQSIFLHNHNIPVPEKLVGSLEISGRKLSVNVGAHMTAWRAVAPGDNTSPLFSGAQFGQKMPNGLPDNKWIWPPALGSQIGPIRIFPICYSATPVLPVIAHK